jgi:competence protein ComEC
VLWPIGEWAGRQDLGENDRSLVCRIDFAGKTILLCSDIERLAQREIMNRYPSLRADAVVAPHHGSLRTLDEGFLERLGPDVVLCSCSKRDCERRRVIERAPHGRVLVTARDGAINICIGRTAMVETAAFRLP